MATTGAPAPPAMAAAPVLVDINAVPWAHIAVDETGAPERTLATKLLDLPTPDAKLVPEQLAELHAAVPDAVGREERVDRHLA